MHKILVGLSHQTALYGVPIKSVMDIKIGRESNKGTLYHGGTQVQSQDAYTLKKDY